MKDDKGVMFERAFAAAWARSDALFEMIPHHGLLERPIGLRHPIIFYLGHLPAFAWNQVGRAFLREGHLDAEFDLLFERGIDPADAAQAQKQSISSWPDVASVFAYRDQVRRAIVERIKDVLKREDDVLGRHGRILHVAIEHELMHHETLMYMFAECSEGFIVPPPQALPPEDGPGKQAEIRRIPAGKARVGAEFETIEFGWDNEFGALDVSVPAFRIDSLPVRNRDWLDFLEATPTKSDLWPQSWVDREGQIFVKTVLGPVSFDVASGWPVQVSGEQARAYCAFRGGRLPTEAELHRAAYGDEFDRQRPWNDASADKEAGDFGFTRWYPSPTGKYPAGTSKYGVEELVGNGWEWTCTAFAPLPGFAPYVSSYPGYSADFFDNEHDVVFGASWATDRVFLRPSFRNWYRRNYPYAFTSFRVVWPE